MHSDAGYELASSAREEPRACQRESINYAEREWVTRREGSCLIIGPFVTHGLKSSLVRDDSRSDCSSRDFACENYSKCDLNDRSFI